MAKKKHTVLKVIAIGTGVIIGGVIAKSLYDRSRMKKLQQDYEEDVFPWDDDLDAFDLSSDSGDMALVNQAPEAAASTQDQVFDVMTSVVPANEPPLTQNDFDDTDVAMSQAGSDNADTMPAGNTDISAAEEFVSDESDSEAVQTPVAETEKDPEDLIAEDVADDSASVEETPAMAAENPSLFEDFTKSDILVSADFLSGSDAAPDETLADTAALEDEPVGPNDSCRIVDDEQHDHSDADEDAALRALVTEAESDLEALIAEDVADASPSEDEAVETIAEEPELFEDNQDPEGN